mgnify:CR=1 FL=1
MEPAVSAKTAATHGSDVHLQELQDKKKEEMEE